MKTAARLTDETEIFKEFDHAELKHIDRSQGAEITGLGVDRSISVFSPCSYLQRQQGCLHLG